MFSLRWKQAWRNLWWQKTRAILVILSIAVGLFTFGTILSTRTLVTRDLPLKFEAVNPASATFHLSPFDDALVHSVERMPEVAAADGRYAAVVRYQQPDGEWHDLQLYALDDYEGSEVDMVLPWRGAWPPPRHEVLLERNSLGQTGLSVGDTLRVETSDGLQRDLPIAGLTHDMNQAPAQITGVPYAYVSADTLEWLGLPRRYNQLHILVAGDATDVDNVAAAVARVRHKLENDGLTIYWADVPEPGSYFFNAFLPTIVMLQTVMGVLALVLSVLLAVNVIAAILLQQKLQIGMMKAVGGRAHQISGIYLRMALMFGLCAVVPAVPLSVLAAHAFAGFIAGQLNFDLNELKWDPLILSIEVAIGLLVPMLAALVPVISGTRVSVREVIQDYGLSGGRGDEQPGRRLIHLQDRLPISRPVRLSLRNTFRRRGRLARTLLVLALSGALFMTVWILRASLFGTLEQTLAEQGADVQVQLSEPQRTTRLDGILAGTPGVRAVEYWVIRQGIIILPDGHDGDDLLINGVPVDSAQLDPAITSGRWLAAAAGEVVIPRSLVDEGFEPGDTLRTRIGTEEVDWRIVGVRRAFEPPISPPMVYVDVDELAELIGPGDHADTLRIITTANDEATHVAVQREVEQRLAESGIEVRSTRNGSEDRRIFTERFNIITAILLVLAFLLGTVGGLGLMGTMSLNVLERRREIGVMRAIGASDGAVVRVVLVEGVAIGLISWVLALILSQPISRLMSYYMGMAFLKLPLTYTFAWRGPLMWLGIVIVIATLASIAPALAAARLSVRETLVYE